MAPPLSVDELLAQQAQQPVARPRFVSRKEREKHREAEQAAASEADAAKQAQVKRARIDWLHRGDAKPAPAPAGGSSGRRSARGCAMSTAVISLPTT